MSDLTYVYPVHVYRQDEQGEDSEGLLIGVYADEFTARRVVRERELIEDEWIACGPWPVFTTAHTIGDPDAPSEPTISYRRNGWKPSRV